MIEHRFEYRNEFHASSRFAFFMYGHVDVYEIEYRFKYQNEYHASSRFASFYVWACGWCTRLNIDLNIEMNFMPAADSRFFYVWVCAWFMRSNLDLNIEMNIMPAADSRFFMYGHMDVV